MKLVIDEKAFLSGRADCRSGDFPKENQPPDYYRGYEREIDRCADKAGINNVKLH